jgi:S-methylmethionine-dependent homocysteine/selenocysteine methylase
MAHRARELTFKAMALAQQAVFASQQRQGDRETKEQCEIFPVPSSPHPPVKIAGSMAPVEDCYSPDLVPSDDELAAEHGELARHLADANVDLILAETHNTIREAVAAARAAHATGKPLWVSFTLGPDDHLLSGEALPDAVCAILPFDPQAVLVNCIPVAQVLSALRILRAATPAHIPIGAYGNVGHVDETVGWTLTDAVTPAAYATAARVWRDLGATIIGGCCGTTPAHIRALTSC